MNKKQDSEAIDRLLGSVAFGNVVRAVNMVAPEHGVDDTYRLVHTKHNISKKGADLLYTIKPAGDMGQHLKLTWSRPEGGNIDAASMFDRRRMKDDPVGDWLVAYLENEAGGEMERDVLMRMAQDAGYSKDKVDRARTRRKVLYRHTTDFPTRTIWYLPPKADLPS